MDKSIFHKFLFVSWMMFVTFSSLFSFDIHHISEFSIPHTDKVVHFAFYFGVVVLGFLAFQKENTKVFGKKSNQKLWRWLAFAVFYGVLIEFLQYFFTKNRHGDILDVLANSLGAILGMLAMKHIYLKRYA